MKSLILYAIFLLSSLLGGAIACAEVFEEMNHNIFEVRGNKEPIKACIKNGVYSDLETSLKIKFNKDLQSLDGKEIEFGFDCFDKKKIFKDDDTNSILLIAYVSENVAKTDKTNYIIQDIRIAIVKAGYCSSSSGNCSVFVEGERPEYNKDNYRVSSIDELSFPNKNEHTFSEISNFIKPKQDNEIRIEFVRFVQRRLAKIGTYKSDIDGDWGENSLNALTSAFKERLGSSYDPDKIPAEDIIGVLFGKLIDYKVPVLTPANESKIVDDPVALASEKIHNSLFPEVAIVSSLSGEATGSDAIADTGSAPNQNATLEEHNETVGLNNRIIDLETENEDLLTKYKNSELTVVDNISKHSIFEIWNNQDLKSRVEYKGVMADTSSFPLKPKKSEFKESRCTIGIDKSIKKSFEVALRSRDCFELVLDDGYEEDTTRRRKFGGNTLDVPVLEKQNDEILSIKSDPLSGLGDNLDKASCYLKLEIYKDQEPFKENGEIVKLGIWLENSKESATYFLNNDLKGDRKLKWAGMSLKLVDAAEDSTEQIKQICSVTFDKPIRITLESEAQNDNAPSAIISRDGKVTLKNTPITKKKEKTLVVFLDTYVGPEAGQFLYGFNEAIKDENEQQVQKVYFDGFLKGLKKYIGEKSSFEVVRIYSPNLSVPDEFFESLPSTNISTEDGKSKLESFIEEFSEEFKPGLQGSYNAKKRIMRELQQEIGNTHFLSFGPSGYDASKACGPNNRVGYNANTTIFDVWSDGVYDNLLEQGLSYEVGRQLVAQCKDANRIFGFISKRSKEDSDIAEVVAGKLTKVLGN